MISFATIQQLIDQLMESHRCLGQSLDIFCHTLLPMNGPAGKTIRCNLGVKYLCLCREQYKMIQCTMGRGALYPSIRLELGSIVRWITIGIFIKLEPPPIRVIRGILAFYQWTMDWRNVSLFPVQNKKIKCIFVLCHNSSSMKYLMQQE